MKTTIWLSAMNRIEDGDPQIEGVSPEELAQFRVWFLEFGWDRRLEAEILAGKLDRFVVRARRDC
jgi:hypothetical protein